MSAAALAVALVLLWIPAKALAGNPAIDEYSLDLPDAKGNVESPEHSPVFNAAALPANVVARLEHDPSGKALAVIATAGELGAPGPADAAERSAKVEGRQPSTLGAVGGALADPGVFGLVALLALICGGIFLSRAGSRGPES